MVRIGITDNRGHLGCDLLVKWVELHGAQPVFIPVSLDEQVGSLALHLSRTESLLKQCHGILLPGNDFDIPPMFYGEDWHTESRRPKERDKQNVRFDTEVYVSKFVLKHTVPFLAVCGGMHVFNVSMGGSLIQHIPDTIQNKTSKIMHDDPDFQEKSKILANNLQESFEKIKTNPMGIGIFKQPHSMRVLPKSGLSDLYLEADPKNNLGKIFELSLHHQGCFKQNLSSGLMPVALSPDQIIEAAEVVGYPTFNLLIQPHIEYNLGGVASITIKKLVEAAEKRAY